MSVLEPNSLLEGCSKKTSSDWRRLLLHKSGVMFLEFCVIALLISYWSIIF